MKLEAGKTYKTRDGRIAKVLCTDAPGQHCVVGYLLPNRDNCPPDELARSWTIEGTHRTDCESGALQDLIAEHREPREWTVTVNITGDRIYPFYPAIPDPDRGGGTIKVREVLEP